jgi:ABC-type transport system involved in multi-copper enzyme maturation permease subunit
VRVGLLQVFRRKSYWIVLALGLLNFILVWSVIYGVTQFEITRRAQVRLLEAFGFSAGADADSQDNGYFQFMQRQNIVVMILLAFSGSLLVGSDFRMNSLPFYLSRRIDRRHYIVGKLLTISSVVLLLTTLPALLLYLEFGLFTSSIEYWVDNWRVVVSILAYSLVLCTVLSILLVTFSAYLQRVAPIAITWSSLFVLLRTMSGYLRAVTDNDYWSLIDPWRNVRYVGRLCFGNFKNHQEFELALWALLILFVLCGVSLALLVRRVRAVEIVS